MKQAPSSGSSAQPSRTHLRSRDKRALRAQKRRGSVAGLPIRCRAVTIKSTALRAKQGKFSGLDEAAGVADSASFRPEQRSPALRWSAQGNRPRLELADIVRRYRPAYQVAHALTLSERAVLDAVERCRTSELDGHLDVCLECGHERPSYSSCHNRHCPKCPAVAQAKWIAGWLERVLPTHYFHVVLTLPSELRAIARGNPVLVYVLLFRCAAATLLELGRDTNRLGGELGVAAVLHTWSRDLSYHPHVHGVATGGALSLDGERWRPARDNYLFPVEVMGKSWMRCAAHERAVTCERMTPLASWPSWPNCIARTGSSTASAPSVVRSRWSATSVSIRTGSLCRTTA